MGALERALTIEELKAIARRRVVEGGAGGQRQGGEDGEAHAGRGSNRAASAGAGTPAIATSCTVP